MTLIDGTSGSAPAGKCGFSSRSFRYAQPQRVQRLGRRHIFGAVLKAADIKSAQPGSALCGFAQPRLTLTGQRSETDEHYGPGLPVVATSISGGHHMVCRKIGNPCAEKVLQDRSQQSFA